MTIIEYIHKYKNDTFEDVSFNEVDNVILSAVSYVDLDQIVCSRSYKKITMEKAAMAFFSEYIENKNSMISYKHAVEIFEEIAKTKRYGNLLLYNYCYIGDDKRQFSAITIEISSDLIYVSYEGTDHLVSGWREDFQMSYMFPVPAQQHAIRYLDRFIMSKKRIILGGHSKGGNLALVAGMYANMLVQSKIIAIYSNDGPGLRKAQIESFKYKKIASKFVSIIPNYSLVGLLLRHSSNHRVILSSKKGMLAHDLLTWQVNDQEFIYAELSTFSRILDKSMLEWVNKYDDFQRKMFTESLFRVFERANVHSLVEIMDNKKLILKLILESRGIDQTTRKMLREFIWVIFEYARDYKKVEE